MVKLNINKNFKFVVSFIEKQKTNNHVVNVSYCKDKTLLPIIHK